MERPRYFYHSFLRPRAGENAIEAEGNEADYIRQTSPEFWDREITGGRYHFRRIEEALVYPRFDGGQVLTTVGRVIVPRAAVKSTKQILSSAGLDIPVVSRLWTCVG